MPSYRPSHRTPASRKYWYPVFGQFKPSIVSFCAIIIITDVEASTVESNPHIAIDWLLEGLEQYPD